MTEFRFFKQVEKSTSKYNGDGVKKDGDGVKNRTQRL